MSTQERGSVVEPGIHRVEMRSAPRIPIKQRCFVRPGDANVPEAWPCVAYNLSTSGIGVTLPIRLQVGTMLSIEARGLPGARPLRARIVHATPFDFYWLTGCELLQPLSDADFQTWCSGWLARKEPGAE
jgi:hypothetical protein